MVEKICIGADEGRETDMSYGSLKAKRKKGNGSEGTLVHCLVYNLTTVS